MKHILLLVGVILFTQNANAQQDAMYTHYMFNTQLVNPAYAGNRGVTTMTLLHRSQWVGVKGAPMSQTFTLNTPIFRNQLGLGVSLQNDRIGPTNIFSGNVDLAYRLKLNKKNHLAFGIKGAFTHYDRNLRNLNSYESGDLAIDNSTRTDMFLDLGLGILYTNDHFYVGISTPKTIFYNFAGSEGDVAAREIQHFYFTAGGAVNLGAKAVWKPSTFVRAAYGAPITIDASTLFEFNKKFEIGAMWRSTDALGLLLGYTFKEQFRIGYSFDWSFGHRTLDYNFGSHEVMLRYELFYKGKENITSPRYF